MTQSRRDALKLIVLGSALAACGGAGERELTCDDTHDLSSTDADFRRAQAYAERSTRPDRSCSGCSFFSAGASGACGSCSVVRGPINPAGYCNLWSARPT
jgi:hypothetical protein